MSRAIFLCIFAATVFAADTRSQRLVERLSQEATAFEKIAPSVLGRETLVQRAIKAAPRIRLRVGKAATAPTEPEWQQRTLVSEYGFTTFEPGGPLHELRQVTSADGRPVKNSGPEALARIILASNENRKRELAEQFASHGLRGAATDFGQIILLFAPSGILHYEFLFQGTQNLKGTIADVFNFQQIDGPNPLTIVGAGKNIESLRISGQVWVSSGTYVPLRIVLRATSGTVEQEATVEYKVSNYAAVLPSETHHREMQNGMLTAQNDFTYTGFRRFGATAGIVFDEETPTPK
ncbi:MAG: hypothetical protein WDO18_11325 [Acidobacteriota bacterium]